MVGPLSHALWRCSNKDWATSWQGCWTLWYRAHMNIKWKVEVRKWFERPSYNLYVKDYMMLWYSSLNLHQNRPAGDPRGLVLRGYAVTSLFSPGVRLPGDGDRAAQHHPVSGRCPPPPAERWGAAPPPACPRRATTQGHSDAQQRQAVRGRGARPAGAETGPRGRPGGPRLHTHPGLPRVPQVSGPAGAAVASSQRGKSRVGKNHQQQRAWVASRHRKGCSEARWGGGRVGRALLSVQAPQSYRVHTSLRILDPVILQKDQRSDAPSQRQRPDPETGSTQGRCSRVGKGHSPDLKNHKEGTFSRPQNHKDASFSVGFSLWPKW